MNTKVEIAERGRPLGSPFRVWLAFRVVPFLAASLVAFLRGTLRIRRVDFGPIQELAARDQRIILSFWHRRLVMMPLAYPFVRQNIRGERRGVAILSSDSRDGERSAATWSWFGIHAVRGTAAEGGAKALVSMIRDVKEGWDFGITPDGPRGPRQKLKPGVIALAKKTGAWVVPVCVAYNRAWKLKTWDEMLIPRPFSRVEVRYGAPFQVTDPAEEDLLVQQLEDMMNAMEVEAEAYGRS